MKNTILIVLVFVSFQLKANISLPAIINDGMVLQRNETVKVWGRGEPDEEVSINFLNNSFHTVTDKSGKWMVRLNPMKAGGPYTMEICGNNKITLKNIYIGDVWVCSGQSNMVHTLKQHAELYTKDIEEANFPEIRQFYVHTKSSPTPLENVPDLKWSSVTPTNVLGFTAVGYFFAKKIYDKYHVPIGIINTASGGSHIEYWMSETGIREIPELLKSVQEKELADNVFTNNKLSDSATEETMQEFDKGFTEETKWYDPAYQPTNWKKINVPGYWEDQGVKNLDGVVWYRRIINIPKSLAGKDVVVKLGRILQTDELYINGKKVGNTTYEFPQRVYKIGSDLLKSGKNIFVIRVTNTTGKGGFVPDKPYFLISGRDTIDLKGDWFYKVGQVIDKRKKTSVNNTQFGGQINFTADQSCSSLYNGMIAPYTNFAIKGFLWYQGEGNTSNPKPYAALLPELIIDWRNQWQQGNLPFLIVQLPNYLDVSYVPEESNWAKIRDIQLQTAEVTPNTGLGINIDLGEWNDVHPDKKKPVGERLALQAMKIAYGERSIVSSGPVRKSAVIEGNKVIISFDNVGSGLITSNGENPNHFSIAGEDGFYQWAKAEIKNNQVIVWNDKIPKPVSVRYAWADNPDFANLYNKEGLPASPFQINLK